jgi:hypothetical protein
VMLAADLRVPQRPFFSTVFSMYRAIGAIGADCLDSSIRETSREVFFALRTLFCLIL